MNDDENNNEAAAVQPAPAPSLEPSDLANAVKVIDLATERGAWRGPELGPVASVRSKFVAYLEYLQKSGPGQ